MRSRAAAGETAGTMGAERVLNRAADVGANIGVWLLLAGLIAAAVFTASSGNGTNPAAIPARPVPTPVVAAETARPSATTVYLVFESPERASASNALVSASRGGLTTKAVVAQSDLVLQALISLLTSDSVCPPAACGPLLVLDLRTR